MIFLGEVIIESSRAYNLQTRELRAQFRDAHRLGYPTGQVTFLRQALATELADPGSISISQCLRPELVFTFLKGKGIPGLRES